MKLTTLIFTASALMLTACGGSTPKEPAPEPSAPAAQPEAAQQAEPTPTEEPASNGELLYQGHASLRIITPEEKVIYIDPFAPSDYSMPADLILVTHEHYDHNEIERIDNRNDDCTVITQNEALAGGTHQTFDTGYAMIEAVEAGNNPNHSITQCVGYVITLTDGTVIYVSGDTSKTDEMASLGDRNIDYAFFCCDGVYNMDLAEAGECASLVHAKHTVPYHVIPPEGSYFDEQRAASFPAEHLLILKPGETITLTHES